MSHVWEKVQPFQSADTRDFLQKELNKRLLTENVTTSPCVSYHKTMTYCNQCFNVNLWLKLLSKKNNDLTPPGTCLILEQMWMWTFVCFFQSLCRSTVDLWDALLQESWTAASHVDWSENKHWVRNQKGWVLNIFTQHWTTVLMSYAHDCGYVNINRSEGSHWPGQEVPLFLELN